MGKFIPDPQIGGLLGILLWIFAISLLVVFLFTTGLGPLLVWAIVMGAVVIVAFFFLSRIIFRLKRGK